MNDDHHEIRRLMFVVLGTSANVWIDADNRIRLGDSERERELARRLEPYQDGRAAAHYREITKHDIPF